MKEFVWIYNNHQSDYYFSQGIVPVATGIGDKGDPYVKFRNDTKVQDTFTKWCNRVH